MFRKTSGEVLKKLKNSKGSVYYGMHFYPGVAEYSEPGKDAFRVFLNENTIRKMGPSFQGRPVFVSHVDEVNDNINELRKEVDGWVIESFFNEADGKHWVKFIVCSERAEAAIKKGFRLSNCYIPKSFTNGGLWNGVSYQKEITAGEYEHLAIVPNPRYEESVIMSPDEFKKYNESKRIELIKLANNDNPKKEDDTMKLGFFKKEKVENSKDIEGVSLVLPNSKKEYTITELANAMDDVLVNKDKPRLANSADFVEIDGEKVTVEELVKTFNAKKCNEDDEDDKVENEDEEEEDDKVENEDEDEGAKASEDKDPVEEEKKKNKGKKKNSLEAREKAERLRNAGSHSASEQAQVYTSSQSVDLGKSRYGSGR